MQNHYYRIAKSKLKIFLSFLKFLYLYLVGSHRKSLIKNTLKCIKLFLINFNVYKIITKTIVENENPTFYADETPLNYDSRCTPKKMDNSTPLGVAKFRVDSIHRQGYFEYQCLLYCLNVLIPYLIY